MRIGRVMTASGVETALAVLKDDGQEIFAVCRDVAPYIKGGADIDVTEDMRSLLHEGSIGWQSLQRIDSFLHSREGLQWLDGHQTYPV
ncbi:MAG: hypothetical protein OWS74_07985, partial [Firmicutes bacterium]|nr:hypothetical protein [Bacillota bacterium]